MILSLLEQPLEIAPGHVLGDDVGPAVLLADVVDGDDVGVVAQAAHRLRLAVDSDQAGLVQALRLDDSDGDIPV